MTTGTKVAIFFGVAGLALAWYLNKNTGVNGFVSHALDGSNLDSPLNPGLATGGNGFAGTVNHTMGATAPQGSLANDVIRRPTLAIDPPWNDKNSVGTGATTSASSA